ncbi:hydroxymethylbilane synthase [Methanothrix sp.]|uniref:hydroxymethylbilane synthase n=1 Tax=Methanothrix sp. TaxID=90426 RepID=UPI003BAF59BF
MIVGTRGSPLALRQTEIVRERLSSLGIQTELRRVKTSGDLFLDKPLHQLGGFGVFVTEIDERMLAGEIDLAVHSMKDLPSKRPEELSLSAVLKRDSPYDALLSRRDSAEGIEELDWGATVGTSSMRRAAQLLRARPDLNISSLRGNLQTRLKKLEQGEYDAIVLAEAGLERMGLNPGHVRLDGERFVPSANQGTIIVVARAGSLAEACSRPLDDAHTRTETMIERKIMEVVGGGCVVPMAAHARVEKEKARVLAEVLSRDGKRFVRLEESIPLEEDYLRLAEDIGERLMRMGGRELVDEAVRFFGNR